MAATTYRIGQVVPSRVQTYITGVCINRVHAESAYITGVCINRVHAESDIFCGLKEARDISFSSTA